MVWPHSSIVAEFSIGPPFPWSNPVLIPSRRGGLPGGLDAGVRAGEEEGVMPAVRPAHQIRRPTIGPMHFDHLAVAVRVTNAVALDHDAITWFGLHAALPSPDDRALDATPSPGSKVLWAH